ncbi:hypothetical protein MGYG_09086 [Nannizzia gypsea CBS 118893]|uniref:Uncharacterized protein n=1 Tax=Arthroderma gypseum (strain ATCC MYA-4604 / CBS 118893) TaxID=535722 RepID=E4UW05_ARTGP|nr:hypothetical protein MGYG_09086 [Nannizzia gypsea CBS 118893]EFR02453.1 hypothetical protein MGYG_09086 [Nannizzia gypsea CBS 118893]
MDKPPVEIAASRLPAGLVALQSQSSSIKGRPAPASETEVGGFAAEGIKVLLYASCYKDRAHHRLPTGCLTASPGNHANSSSTPPAGDPCLDISTRPYSLTGFCYI